jgi:circadian clock protein KaiC
MELKENTGIFTPLKAPTGIEGFDEITGGGMPRGCTTLIEGGAGSGKTIMALQSLVNGARFFGEAGIFVAFEETSERILANAARFGWDLAGLQGEKLYFHNLMPTPDLIQSGSFDLGGMLASLEVKAEEMKAKRIVFDALDIVLALLDDPLAVRRELYRLQEWLMARGFTGIITAKAGGDPHMGFMQFMVDCWVTLKHEVVEGISQRNLRVVKYRGSSFSENESPFFIGASGLEVAGDCEIESVGKGELPVVTERVSTGVARLDAMLGGGYYRGAGVLITGSPGTAKSTLSGAFVEAACERGERALFVSFDSDAYEVVRNLVSVNIQLERFVKSGVLQVVSARAVNSNAELHLMQIKTLAKKHGARCLVIDPVSALSKSGNRSSAFGVAERLVDWTKQMGITLVCTSLLEDSGGQVEGTPVQVSTIADTWIHLSYRVNAGERNRGLSIIKSRGTFHSNQVRELLLSQNGVTLADAYTAGGEVLMGTMRWEKEQAQRASQESEKVSSEQKQAAIANEEALLEMRLRAIELELQMKRAEKQSMSRLTTNRTAESASGHHQLRELRGVDKS